LLRRATALLDPVDARRLALLPVLGRVLHALGRFDEAFAAFDEAIERADPDTAAHAFFYKSYVQGHGEARSGYELERDVRDRLSLVEAEASDQTLAAGYLALGWGLYWTGRLGEGLDAASRAVEHARSSGDLQLEMDALRLRAVAMLHGDMPWPEVERELDEMRWSGAHQGPVRGFAASSQGRYADARQIYEENVRELREQGQVLVAALQALWYGCQ
jgi:tetratricopeptide (TPR) repeat protein